MPLTLVHLVMMYVGQSTQRLLGSHQPGCGFVHFAEEFFQGIKIPRTSFCLEKMVFLHYICCLSMQQHKEQEGLWQLLLFFLKQLIFLFFFYIREVQSRWFGLCDTKGPACLKQGHIFCPYALCNLGCSSVFFWKQFNKCIYWNKEELVDSRTTADGAEPISAPPLVTQRCLHSVVMAGESPLGAWTGIVLPDVCLWHAKGVKREER